MILPCDRSADNVDRVQKLKDARSEAAKEIEEYKAKKEAEYKNFESEVCHLCPRSSYPRVSRETQGQVILAARSRGPINM